MAPSFSSGPFRQPKWTLPTLPGGHPARVSEVQFQAALVTLRADFELAPSTATFAKSLKGLPKDEKRALADRLNDLKALSSDEQKDFAYGIRQELRSADGQDILQQAAETGGTACKDIEQQFVNLRRDLVKIDDAFAAIGENHEPFAPMLDVPKLTYTGIIKDCKSLSMAISVYSARFGEIILEFVGDDTLDRTQRSRDASGFQSKSDDIQQRLKNLQKEFSGVMDKFESFSKNGRSQQLQDEIAAARKRLENLDQQLNALKATLTGIAAAPGVLGPLAAGLAAIFPPAAVFILAGGLIAGAGLAVTASVLGGEVASIEEDKREEQDNLKALLAAAGVHTDASQKLQRISRENRDAFNASIGLILDVFENVSVDAQSISTWLQQGADVSAKPKLMHLSLDEAGDIYVTMAEYLKTFSLHI